MAPACFQTTRRWDGWVRCRLGETFIWTAGAEFGVGGVDVRLGLHAEWFKRKEEARDLPAEPISLLFLPPRLVVVQRSGRRLRSAAAGVTAGRQIRRGLGLRPSELSCLWVALIRRSKKWRVLLCSPSWLFCRARPVLKLSETASIVRRNSCPFRSES